MKARKLLVGSVLVVAVGAAAWFGWRWYTTPMPPHIPLEGVNKERVEKIERALNDVRNRPRSGKAWGELGLILMINGFPEQSIPCFAHAQRFDPKQPRWPYYLGTTSLASGRREGFTKLREALTAARTAQERRAILFPLARLLVQDGQVDEAARRTEELRAIEGDSPGVDFLLGLLAIGRDDRAAARAHLERLTDHPAARRRVCSLLASLAEDALVAREYQRRADSFPGDQPWPGSFESELDGYGAEAPLSVDEYFALINAGRPDEALQVLRDQVARVPDEGACFVLGFSLIGRGHFEEAASALRKATTFNPRSAKAYTFLGVALYEMGMKQYRDANGRKQAMDLFRQSLVAEDKALSIKSDTADAHLTRGRVLILLGRTDEGLAALRQAALIGTEHAEMHQALGEALAEVGQIREGLEHLENAVKLAKPYEREPRQALEKWKAKAKEPPK